MQHDESHIFLEIGREGIVRVFVVGEEDDVDGQSDAHQLLAEITPNLILLDKALKQSLQEGGKS